MFRIPAWSGGPNSCPELPLIPNDKHIQCKVESFSPSACRRVCWNIFPRCTDNAAGSRRCGHSSIPPDRAPPSPPPQAFAEGRRVP